MMSSALMQRSLMESAVQSVQTLMDQILGLQVHLVHLVHLEVMGTLALPDLLALPEMVEELYIKVNMDMDMDMDMEGVARKVATEH